MPALPETVIQQTISYQNIRVGAGSPNAIKQYGEPGWIYQDWTGGALYVCTASGTAGWVVVTTGAPPAPASLICETRPSDPSTYLIASPANNIIAFDTATGSDTSVYDSSTGVFTLPADGVYALSVAMIIDSLDGLAFEYAGVTLLVNSSATYSFPDGVLSPPPYPRAVVIGTVMLEGVVGDEIQLNVYLQDSGSNDGGNLIDVPYSNYISLFKL